MKYISAGVAIFLAASALCAPARADTKTDTATILQAMAQWAAIPTETVSPQAVTALGIESTLAPRKRPSEIVFEMPDTVPAHATLNKDNSPLFSWTARLTLSPGAAANTLQIEAWQCYRDAFDFIGYDSNIAKHKNIKIKGDTACTTIKIITDASSLSELYMDEFSQRSDGLLKSHSMPREFKLTDYSVQGPPVTAAANGAMTVPFSTYSFKAGRSNEGSGSDYDLDGYSEDSCNIAPDGQDLLVKCHRTADMAYHKFGKPPLITAAPSDYVERFVWNDVMGLYTINYEDICLRDTGCMGVNASHKIVDYKIDGAWHSKAVSAALSPEDRQKANGLFQTGFESFKSGDFTSATALLKKGLEIDPANYLGYFTLADMWRSKHLRDPNDAWAMVCALYYYQRTLELSPPDTPESIKAEAHLTTGSLD